MRQVWKLVKKLGARSVDARGKYNAVVFGGADFALRIGLTLIIGIDSRETGCSMAMEMSAPSTLSSLKNTPTANGNMSPNDKEVVIESYTDNLAI